MSEMRRWDSEQRARCGLGPPRFLNAPVCEGVKQMTALTVP